jgi:hypothetical protein
VKRHGKDDPKTRRGTLGEGKLGSRRPERVDFFLVRFFFGRGVGERYVVCFVARLLGEDTFQRTQGVEHGETSV